MAVSFGGLLRSLREERMLSQLALATRSGLSVRALCDLENDRVRRPRTVSVRLLADGLRLDPVQRDRLTRAARGERPGG